jgi:hypothetical protein
MKNMENCSLECTEGPLPQFPSALGNSDGVPRPPFGDANTCPRRYGTSPVVKQPASYRPLKAKSHQLSGDHTPMLNQPDPWSRKRAAEGSPEPIKRASTTGADSCLGPSSRNLLWTFVSSPADSPCSDISQSSILSSFSKVKPANPELRGSSRVDGPRVLHPRLHCFFLQ